MECRFTDQEIYQKEFEPQDYLQTYFNKTTGAFVSDKYLKFILTNLHKTFSSGEVRGHTLIDIGCGPSIYQVMSACESFEEIIAVDLCEKNRREYNRWLKNEPGAFDWSTIGKLVCELEGDSEKWTEKEKKIRTKVKQVLKCDIMEKNPLDPIVLPQADCLLSLLCMESVCKDHDAYQCALENITTLLKPGGHLVLCGVLGSKAYMVGEKVFSSLPLEEEFLRTTLTNTGYDIKELEVEPVASKCNKSICDYYGNFFLLAQKQKDV